MATAQEVSDNYLSCSICTDVFTSPVTLSCDHTFCKLCLLEYARPKVGDSASAIPCPTCGQQTDCSNQDGTLNDWIERMKPSRIIKGLLHDVADDGNVTSVCIVCKTTPGSKWCMDCEDIFCESCILYHDKMPASRNHNTTNLNGKHMANHKKHFPCEEHNNETVRLYCRDCKTPSCVLCCSIYHRKCDEVVLLDTLTPMVTEALTNKLEEIRSSVNAREQAILDANAEAGRIREEEARLAQHVQSDWTKVIEFVKSKEKQQLDSLHASVNENVRELEKFISDCNERISNARNQSQELVAALSSCSLKVLHDRYAQCESGTESENASGQKKPVIGYLNYVSVRDEIVDVASAVEVSDISIVRSMLDLAAVPLVQRTIRVREDQALGDIVILKGENSKVILAMNRSGRNLQIFENDGVKQSSVQVKSGGWAMTKISGNSFAITFPDEKKICVYAFNTFFTKINEINGERAYYSIAYKGGAQLIVGTYKQKKSVDIIDMSGNILRSITTCDIRSPEVIIVTRGRIIVSAKDILLLECVTFAGKPVFTYRPTGGNELIDPCAVAVTPTGDILLSDVKQGKVIHLTETGQFVRDLITDLDHPMGLSLDEDGTLYIATNKGILVYDFQ